MAKVKPRSKRKIAKSDSEQDQQRIDRAAKMAARNARRIAKHAEGWTQVRKAFRAHERQRAGQRRLQEAGVEWLMDYDTPAARLFSTFVEKESKAIREVARRQKLGADLLNLTGDKPKLSKKQERAAAETERLRRGERKITLPDPEHPRQNVLVSAMPHSLRRLKLKLHQEPAAERFVSDWESAGYSGLSSPGFDPKVDSSSKQTAGHMRAAEAQTRLKMAERHIGERNYDICRGVLILNANASRIHAIGGRDHRTVSSDIDIALNALAGFYDPVRLERDPTWKAFKQILEGGDAVIKKLEKEVR